MPLDWRGLYAANQATIARAGIRPGTVAPLRLRVGMPGHVQTPPWALAGQSRRPTNGALVHVPRGVDPSVPTALVCMLHGCTQDPATFAHATAMNAAADRHGFVVLYPGQDRSRNPQGCWNWFMPEHQQRGAGEPAVIAALLDELIQHDSRFTIDANRVFVSGLSAGGAMALILATCYPDLIAATAIHSGLAYRSAHDLPSAFAAMSQSADGRAALGRAAYAAMGRHARPVPSLVIHGTADRTVAPANARRILRQSMAANHLADPATCDHDITRPTRSHRSHGPGAHPHTKSQWLDTHGTLIHELILIEGLGHAWSGGTPGGSHTDPRGPSATEAICTFFSLATPPAATGERTPTARRTASSSASPTVA